MLYVLPVYENSLIISESTHQALLGPGPAYKPFANHRSFEVHTVTWIPGPWVVKTKTVLADGQVFMLEGHDTGMMIPHISTMMDNLMLPVTLLTSSCAWPFMTGTRSVGGKCVVGFLPFIAPFNFCDAPEDWGTDSATAMNGKQPSKPPAKSVDSQPRVGNVLTRDRALAIGRSGGKYAVRGAVVAGKVASKLGPVAAQITKVDGKGLIYIPLCKTVVMRMRLTEVLAGWARIFASNAVSAVTSRVFKPLKHPATVRRGSQDIPIFSEALTDRLTKREVAKYLGTTLVNKAAVDGVLKSMVLDMKIKAPYGVFKYDINKGKGSYLYWGTFDGVHPPEEFPLKGLQSHFDAWAGKGLDTKPIDTLTQTPNVAGA